MRGDDRFNEVVEITPGSYVLGVGKGKDGQRDEFGIKSDGNFGRDEAPKSPGDAPGTFTARVQSAETLSGAAYRGQGRPNWWLRRAAPKPGEKPFIQIPVKAGDMEFDADVAGLRPGEYVLGVGADIRRHFKVEQAGDVSWDPDKRQWDDLSEEERDRIRDEVYSVTPAAPPEPPMERIAEPEPAAPETPAATTPGDGVALWPVYADQQTGKGGKIHVTLGYAQDGKNVHLRDPRTGDLLAYVPPDSPDGEMAFDQLLAEGAIDRIEPEDAAQILADNWTPENLQMLGVAMQIASADNAARIAADAPKAKTYKQREKKANDKLYKDFSLLSSLREARTPGEQEAVDALNEQHVKNYRRSEQFVKELEERNALLKRDEVMAQQIHALLGPIAEERGYPGAAEPPTEPEPTPPAEEPISDWSQLQAPAEPEPETDTTPASTWADLPAPEPTPAAVTDDAPAAMPEMPVAAPEPEPAATPAAVAEATEEIVEAVQGDGPDAGDMAEIMPTAVTPESSHEVCAQAMTEAVAARAAAGNVAQAAQADLASAEAQLEELAGRTGLPGLDDLPGGRHETGIAGQGRGHPGVRSGCIGGTAIAPGREGTPAGPPQAGWRRSSRLGPAATPAPAERKRRAADRRVESVQPGTAGAGRGGVQPLAGAHHRGAPRPGVRRGRPEPRRDADANRPRVSDALHGRPSPGGAGAHRATGAGDGNAPGSPAALSAATASQSPHRIRGVQRSPPQAPFVRRPLRQAQ